MPDDDRKILLEILQSVARLETEVKSIKVVSDTANEAKDTAREALLSTKSAHKRLDDMDREINSVKNSLKESEKESNNKWEHVWQKAFWALLSGIVTLAAGHYFHF